MSEAVHTVTGMKAEREHEAAADAPVGAPTWTRVIGVFDLETTGVDVASDRIVTAHVGLLDAKGAVILARDWIADPGIEIPESAAAIHGVTTAHARAVGAPASDVVEQIVDVLRVAARCRHPGRRLQRRVRLLTPRRGVDPARHPAAA